MKPVTIGDRISAVDHEDQTTTIIIMPKRVMWKEALLTLWLAGFSFVGITLIYILATGVQQLNSRPDMTAEDYDNQIIYLIVFLGFWAYFQFRTTRAWLWYRFGRELIKIDETSLSIKRSILGYGKAKRYFFENIKKFSLIKEDKFNFGNFFENSFWAMGTDILSFDYFNKVITFARRVDLKEARSLQRLIDDRVKKAIRRRK